MSQEFLNGDEIFGQNTSYIPKYFYVSLIDKYFTRDGDIFTDDDFVAFDRMEKEWKSKQKDYSFFELIQIFPEAIKVARKNLKSELKRIKSIRTSLTTWRDNCNETLNKFHNPDERDFYKKHFDESLEVSLAEVERKIKKIMFALSHLDEIEGKKEHKPTNGVSESDIAKAKEISILNFYIGKPLQKHGNLAVGKCPFHNEKDASFTVYLDQNTFYCYGCNAGGTVIDFVMRQQNIDFLSAVKVLLK